jgi:hypothetical protein
MRPPRQWQTPLKHQTQHLAKLILPTVARSSRNRGQDPSDRSTHRRNGLGVSAMITSEKRFQFRSWFLIIKSKLKLETSN